MMLRFASHDEPRRLIRTSRNEMNARCDAYSRLAEALRHYIKDAATLPGKIITAEAGQYALFEMWER
jgi:hypothetical protein